MSTGITSCRLKSAMKLGDDVRGDRDGLIRKVELEGSARSRGLSLFTLFVSRSCCLVVSVYFVLPNCAVHLGTSFILSSLGRWHENYRSEPKYCWAAIDSVASRSSSRLQSSSKAVRVPTTRSETPSQAVPRQSLFAFSPVLNVKGRDLRRSNSGASIRKSVTALEMKLPQVVRRSQ